MNTNTDFDKIDKVLSKISGKEMKGFVRQYAATHEDFATALVERYWKPERGNYKEQVEACFAHAGVLGKRFGQPQLDWRKIEQDLGAMLRKAKGMKKKGNLIDAALIAGYVMTITCREFKHDHLATASLYGWRTKAVCARLCGMGPPGERGRQKNIIILCLFA